jgi:hypothetical protein
VDDVLYQQPGALGPEVPALYWGIRLGGIRQGAWKIDLWAMDSAACRSALENCDRVAARLTPDSRQAILALKAQLWHHPAYRDTITGKTVYDAVLDGGVADLDAFWAFVRSRSDAAPSSAELGHAEPLAAPDRAAP